MEPSDTGSIYRRGAKPRDSHLSRVIVKYNDNIGIPYEFGVERIIRERYPSLWKDLLARFPKSVAETLTVQPLFLALGLDELAAVIEKARRNNPSYHPPDFSSYFVFRASAGTDYELLARELNVREKWKMIDYAYVEKVSTASPSDRYRNPAPTGVDVASAWSEGLPGKGDGMNIVDIEQGWDFGDPDLPPNIGPPIHGCNTTALPHGSAVLSILVGVGGTKVGGIAPFAKVKVASLYYGQWNAQTQKYDTTFCGEPPSVHEALQAAQSYLLTNGKEGDVILVEAQAAPDFVLVEVEDAVFDLIELITMAGYIVIEAAGNGGQSGLTDEGVNIDDFLRRNGDGAVRDSGAIVVGASLRAAGHACCLLTNFGSRVDCFAWGEYISAAGLGSTGRFGGTSGASAIIAGVVLCVQGIALERHGSCYSSRQLRQIISVGGTASSSNSTKPIGLMPNLLTLLSQVETTPPV